MLENENTNNIEKNEELEMKETAVDEIKTEEAISKADTKVSDDTTDKNKLYKKGRQSEFFSGLKAGIIDTIIMLIISGILLCITGVILMYILGYYITNILGMLFIVFAIVSVLYPAFKSCFLFCRLHKTN